jgi:hypothetical protein
MSEQQRWTVQRICIEATDAQRRWDLAYQCLLKWSQETREKETGNESRDLRQSIDPAPGRRPDH